MFPKAARVARIALQAYTTAPKPQDERTAQTQSEPLCKNSPTYFEGDLINVPGLAGMEPLPQAAYLPPDQSRNSSGNLLLSAGQRFTPDGVIDPQLLELDRSMKLNRALGSKFASITVASIPYQQAGPSSSSGPSGQQPHQSGSVDAKAALSLSHRQPDLNGNFGGTAVLMPNQPAYPVLSQPAYVEYCVEYTIQVQNQHNCLPSFASSMAALYTPNQVQNQHNDLYGFATPMAAPYMSHPAIVSASSFPGPMVADPTVYQPTDPPGSFGRMAGGPDMSYNTVAQISDSTVGYMIGPLESRGVPNLSHLAHNSAPTSTGL